MLSKKRILANLLSALGVISLVAIYRKLFSKRLIILAYHRVCDVDLSQIDNTDQELISASKQDFQWQVKFLMKNYHVTTFEKYEKLTNLEKIKRNIVIITFDDGFGDNYYNAFPILESEKSTAVFYISTDYISNGERFWFESLVTLIKALSDTEWKDFCEIVGFDEGSVRKEDRAISVLESFKRIDNNSRIKILKNIHKKFPIENSKRPDKYMLPMNWDQVKEMSERGMEIGSHTKSHPILSNLNKSEITSEILDSKILIEENTGKKCFSMSYPNGGVEDYNKTIINQVISSKYSYACAYVTGVNEHEKLHNYELKRLPIERYVSKNEFKLMLVLPSIFI